MMSNIGEGATPLMYACQQSREREVLDIIARKRNSVRERDRTLKTPLHYCTENSGTGCAEAVLRAAPELLDAKDEDGYTALHLAVIAGNRNFLRFLVSRGANVNALDNERHSAVHWATVCGEEEALDVILRAGANISTADIHGGYPLHYAAQMCGPGADMGRDSKTGLRILNALLAHNIDINVRDKDGRQPILWAASAGSADAILALVKAGASVEASDKDGLTALHCAASRGHTDCIETLVTLCGAHIDVIDSNGCTALFYSVTLGHADATQLLLSLGAEPNRQDRKGRTPAHCGAAKGQLETLRILLSYNANLWLRNVKGDFPLHEAIASGRKDLVRWLLSQRGDSINVGNNDGRCPIHIAAINNNIDMIKILFDAQSLVNPIMRTTKGNMMTPLDAALHRGFRGCAKYLQLHGGVPFSKLTEKSSNIKGISARQVNSDIYLDNYGDRLEISHWGAQSNSSATLPGFIPNQVKIGGDSAIQQIHESDLREVSRIREDYEEDLRSSNDDEEKVYRRRRRRKKWEHQRKGYISEEDLEFEREIKIAESSRRRGKTVRDEDFQKRDQYNESSSESDHFKRKTIKKKDSTSDSEGKGEIRRTKYSGRKKYHSGTEHSEKDRKRKSNSEMTTRFVPSSIKTDKAIVGIATGDDHLPIIHTATEVKTTAEVHAVEMPTADIVSNPNDSVSFPNNEKGNIERNHTSITETEKAVAEEGEKITPMEPVAEIENRVGKDAKEEENKIEQTEEEPEIQDKVSIQEIQGNDEEGDGGGKSPGEVEEIIEKTVAGDLTETTDVIGVEPKEPTVGETIEDLPVGEESHNEGVFHDKQGETEHEREEEKEGGEEIRSNEEETQENPDEENKEEKLGNEGKEDNPAEEEENEAGATNEGNHEEQEEVEEIIPTIEEDNENIENMLNGIIANEVNEEDYNEMMNEDYMEMDDQLEDNAFQVLDQSQEAGGNPEEGGLGRRSSNSNPTGDPEGSVGDESGGSTRNEDSSALPDSGIEPSPRRKPKDAEADGGGSATYRRVPRLCNRGKDSREVHSVSVTQTVQNTIRKYHMERKIFYQLLELKRLQIRAGRANEQVLVKRLVDEYRRGGIVPGLKNYTGHYTFRQFEKFLYDQLRTLQSTAHLLIPKLKPSDDIETLSTILRKTRVELVDDIPENPIFCTQGTHRCHHAAHAYTGIPCAAYITKFNHHEMPKNRTSGFLPQIDQGHAERMAGQQTYRPVTLELSHGKEKQVISLPTDRLDKNKRYYVTFTIKGAPQTEESKSPEEQTFRHRLNKSF